MTDLTQLLDQIRVNETSHVDMLQRRATGTLQWFLEKDHQTHPIHNRNALRFLVCGQEGFGAIEADIRAATSTIDLVLWGFDPGMELVRQGGTTWPRGTTYGDLLALKAREGVQVRMLLWYQDWLVNKMANNVPDLHLQWLPNLQHGSSGLVAPSHQWLAQHGAGERGGPPSRSQLMAIRAQYCEAWWRAALHGRIPNLEVRMRRGHPLAAGASILQYLPESQDLVEAIAQGLVPTHHQKPVLIDYHAAPDKRPNTCGYVMGLNSVTDYWDGCEHLYNDPRRELHGGGAFWKNAWHRKPYRDYAVRIEGEALFSLNENFVQGWDSAEGLGLFGMGVSRSKGGGLQAQRQGIQREQIPAPPHANQRVQIVRTQPERGDTTVLKAYTLASSNAVNYLYVENQYVQLSGWARLLKSMREKHIAGMKAARRTVADIAPLHLFVVMPQPELAGMVPRTYETLATLGAGQGMARYDTKVQGARKALALDGAPGSSAASMPVQIQQEEIRRLSPATNDFARDSAQVVPANPQRELEALGIKVLVAMLMSFDGKSEARNIRVRQRDNDAQEAQARQEASANPAGLAGDVERGNYSDTNIVPKRYREIYIHSKLMLVDDAYMTLGSANLNSRSMVADSELNICAADYAFVREARRRVWGNLAGVDLDGGDGSLGAVREAHKEWKKRMADNQLGRQKELSPSAESSIHPFEDPRGVPLFRVA